MGNKGFVNKELTDQIEKYAKKKKEREAIAKRILWNFMNLVSRIYGEFWRNHFKQLREQNIDTAKLTRTKRRKDTSIT